MPRRRSSPQARISFAQIDLAEAQVPLTGTLEALREALVPGTTVTRYNRVWHMARTQPDDGFIVGRIGFEREGEPVWDEAAKDFRVGRGAGSTSRFVIDPESLRVAFQLRGTFIEPGTFRFNFQALLNQASEDLGVPWRWRLRLVGVEQPTWEEWQERVDRVVRIWIKMLRPNPRFPGERVEQLFEGAKAKAVQLVMTAQDQESINIDDPFVMEAIELARDQGSLKAEGEEVVDGETRKVPWSDRAEDEAVKVDVPADPTTGEPVPSAMRDELESEEGPGGRGS